MHLEVNVEGETDLYLVEEVLRHLKAELGVSFEYDITQLGGTQICKTGNNFADFPYVRLLRAAYLTFLEEKAGSLAFFIAVLDLDTRDLERHRQDFAQTFPGCEDFALIIAIKEVEAWLIGDIPAIKRAFPRHLPFSRWLPRRNSWRQR